MSTSKDKEEGKAEDDKSSKPKPAKRTRKRQASRPPTIEGEAVHLEAEADAEKASKTNNEEQGAAEATEDDAPDVVTEPEIAAEAGKKSGRFGYGALMLSAVVGAGASVAMFAGVFGVNYFSSDQAALEGRISGLSAKIDTLTVLSEKLPAIEVNGKEIRALNERLGKFSTGPLETQIEAVKAQIQSIEAVLEKSQKQIIGADEIKKLSSRIDSSITQAEQSLKIAQKVSKQALILEDAIKASGQSNSSTPIEGGQNFINAQNLRLAGFEAQIKRMSEDLETLKTEANQSAQKNIVKTVTALQEELINIDKLVKDALTKTSASAALMASVEERLSKLENTDRSVDVGRVAALSFAVDNLVRKVEAGGAFQKELDVVTAAIPNNSQIDKLKALKDTGIKSIAELQNEFQVVLRKILSYRNPQTETGVVNKIVNSAKSLIRIRRVGEIEGDDRGALIARLEARVKRGDLKAALITAKKIKEPSGKVVKEWMQSVEDRLEAIKLVNDVRNEAISNLKNLSTKSGTKE